MEFYCALATKSFLSRQQIKSRRRGDQLPVGRPVPSERKPGAFIRAPKIPKPAEPAVTVERWTTGVSHLAAGAGRSLEPIGRLSGHTAACGCALLALAGMLLRQSIRQLLFLAPAADPRVPEAAVSPSQRMQRTHIFSFAFAVAACVIIGRLYDLQGKEHLKWNTIAQRQHETRIKVGGARGTVFDSSGRILAVSVPALAVGAHPRKIQDKEQAAQLLAPLLGQSEAELREKLAQDRTFVWLDRGLPRELEGEIEKLRLRGISSVPEFRRHYPQGSLAAPILGRVSRDGDGQSGLERAFDARLLATGLSVPVRRDARGRHVAALSGERDFGGGLFASLKGAFRRTALGNEALPALGLSDTTVRDQGADIVLSLDSVIQSIVEQELEQGRVNAKAKRVFGMLMDADSGEILALGQTNGFDPNQLGNVNPEDLRNVIVQDAFEPGSTLKPLVAAAALDAKVVGAQEIMDCESGRYRVGRHTVRDVHPVGVVPLSEVLVRSSNICMVKLGQRLGAPRLHAALAGMGFGRESGIELSEEARGILRSLSNWKPIDVATHSFGQGVSVTAIQLVRAYAALANGGKLVKPTLLRQAPGEAPDAVQIFSPATADTIGRYLRGVTDGEHGTGKKAKISGVHVSGKTGTAQKARTDGRGYDPDRVLSSFIGFINAQEVGVDRRLVMLVVVDEPGVRPRWGGTVAGPVFRSAMERILSHLMASESGAIRTARGDDSHYVS